MKRKQKASSRAPAVSKRNRSIANDDIVEDPPSDQEAINFGSQVS